MTDIALTTPQFWFDNEAREAAAFYCSVFPDSRVLRVTTLHDTPSGAVDVAETDRYWDRLSAVPEAEACGWCKDRSGLSWRIVPRAMGAMMCCVDADKVSRVVRVFLGMKTFDLAALQAAFDVR